MHAFIMTMSDQFHILDAEVLVSHVGLTLSAYLSNEWMNIDEATCKNNSHGNWQGLLYNSLNIGNLYHLEPQYIT